MNINVSKKRSTRPSSLPLFLSLSLRLLVPSSLCLFLLLPLRLVCMMFLPYFCNWLECAHAFWRNRWRTRIRSFPVTNWENAMSYHRKHTAPCCCSPKASSIASTKQTLLQRTHKPSHRHSSCDGKANDFWQRLQTSLLFNTVRAHSYWLRTLDKPMNGCTS